MRKFNLLRVVGVVVRATGPNPNPEMEILSVSYNYYCYGAHSFARYVPQTYVVYVVGGYRPLLDCYGMTTSTY